MLLPEILTAQLFAFFLVFARLGATVMVMPGFGEMYVPPRYRLVLAGAITLAVGPLLTASMPPLPSSPWQLLILLAGEIVIGLFLGLVGRIILSALHTAGTVISFQIGLANALGYDPVSAEQASLTAMFLTIAGVLLVFAADLHHLMLGAMVRSYAVLLPGTVPPLDDFSMVITRLVADVFTLGIQLAAPFIAIGLVFYLGIGLLSRLMPQVQIFFVALPVQIFLGLVAFAIAMGAMLTWFLERFPELYAGAFGG